MYMKKLPGDCAHEFIVTEWEKRFNGGTVSPGGGVWGGPALEMTCRKCLLRVTREVEEVDYNDNGLSGTERLVKDWNV